MQITRSGLVLSPADDLTALRAVFDRVGCLRLLHLLDADLLEIISDQIETAVFDPMTHDGIGSELCMRPNPMLDLLYFLMNDLRVLQVLQQATGGARLGCYIGRVYRMLPGSGHQDSWHADLRDHRVLGLSVNLSPQPYDGGLFQLRERASGTLRCTEVNIGLGDALLFRIGPDLEHQVTPVRGTVAKTAFAGWFRTEPEFLSLLTGAAGHRHGDDQQSRQSRTTTGVP